MLQEVVGPEGAQISSHRCETIRVWPVQVTIQRENEAGQAHLRPHRGKTVQVRFLRSPIWRTLPIEGAQMREPIQDEDRQIVRRLHHPDRLLPSKIDQHLVRFEYKEFYPTVRESTSNLARDKEKKKKKRKSIDGGWISSLLSTRWKRKRKACACVYRLFVL